MQAIYAWKSRQGQDFCLHVLRGRETNRAYDLMLLSDCPYPNRYQLTGRGAHMHVCVFGIVRVLLRRDVPIHAPDK